MVGPRFSPPWERVVTHPALFLVALALGAACLGVGRLTAEEGSDALAVSALAAGAILLLWSAWRAGCFRIASISG